jgi:hypothetical protein
MLLAVLTIWDHCSAAQLADTAGPAVVALLRRAWPQAEVDPAIQETLSKLWSFSAANVAAEMRRFRITLGI